MSSVTAADITISTYVDNVRKFGVFFSDSYISL